MAYPVPWVILSSPQIDNRGATESESRGEYPAHTADPFALLWPGEGFPSNNINNPNSTDERRQCTRPVAVPIPWPYDDAGVAYPPGHVLILAGCGDSSWFGETAPNNISSSMAGASGAKTFRVTKTIWPVRVRVWGIPPGATGTITIGHRNDYGNATPADVIDATFTFDGADGADQVRYYDTCIAAPADFFSLPWFVLSWDWVGGAPAQANMERSAPAMLGYVAPASLPGGYTARADADDHRGGYWGRVHRGFVSRFPYRARALHPANWRFNLNPNAVSVQARINIFPEDSRRFGTPDIYNGGAIPGGYGVPCVWIGNELKEIDNLGNSTGPRRLDGGSAIFLQSYPYGSSGVQTYVYPPTPIVYGPGFRNLRVYFLTDTYQFMLSVTDVIVDVFVDGVLVHTVNIGAGSAGDYSDIGPIIPGTVNNRAEIKLQFTVKVNIPGPDSSQFNIQIAWMFSPRIDIPLPFTVTGPAEDSCVPGGYLPATAIAPRFVGEPARHAAAGVYSSAFAAVGASGSNASYAGTFIPPTTGIWKTQINGSDFPAGFLGEFEFRQLPRVGAICRAGKRAWFHYIRDAATAWTVTLVSIPQVLPAIPGAGINTAANLTAGAYFFGTITVPAAGTYRISNAAAADASLLLAVSESDPYVADFRAGPHVILEGVRAAADPITLDFTTAGPATVYVRFEAWDPFWNYGTSTPASGGASGNLTWAAV